MLVAAVPIWSWAPMMPARRPTIIDVAKLAGVSKTTVSRLFSGQGQLVRGVTRQRIEAAIAELGYVHDEIAATMRSHRTFITLAVVPTVVDPSWPEMTRGMQDVLRTGDYLAAMANSDFDPELERALLDRARRSRFDGIIINPVAATSAALESLGVPVVVLGRSDVEWGLDQVSNDYLSGLRLAADHLLDLGHRRIGLIASASGGASPGAQWQVVEQALRYRGVGADTAMFVDAAYGQEAGVVAMRRLCALPDRPTAVLAANDITAVGALQAARDAGLTVPDDISIVGHGDLSAAALTEPGLTTVFREQYRLGEQAASYLLERMRGDAPSTPRRTIFDCRLVVRSSTAPPRTVS